MNLFLINKIDSWDDLEKNTLIEYNGEMNTICYTQEDQKLYCFLPVDYFDWYKDPFDEHRVHAIILNDVCYIITKSLTFRIFDMVKKTIEKSKPFDGMNLSFEDLQLDSHKSNVILLIKSQKKVMMFDTRNKEWTLMSQIFSEYKLIALTSTDIPVQFIKKLYSKKRVIGKSVSTRSKNADLIKTFENLQWKKSRDSDSIELASLFRDKTNGLASGFFRMNGVCEKPLQKTANYKTIYTLLKGSVAFKIADDPYMVLNEFESVTIPELTSYAIKNLSNDESVLYFNAYQN
uniref:Mif2/CENP-C cupin domain-containing protein n=1 Tax=Tetranychus urticae TaxID=32264 RepID=T1JZY4_TETUR